MPAVQFGLQAVAFGQQLAIARGKVVDQAAEALPEAGGVEGSAGQHFIFDEALQEGGDLEWIHVCLAVHVH
ncbi:hypothetical protein D3C76_1694160 [compost metagenome]